MKDKDKGGFAWSDALIILGFGVPIFVALAPKDIRKELIDYTGKFFGIIFLAGVAYFLYLVLIKDKIDAKGRKNAEEEERERIELARKMARRYTEKEKREE